MSLPAGIATVTVTGTLLHADGSLAAGMVRFVPSVSVLYVGPNAVTLPSRIDSQLVAGVLSVVLPATDDTAGNPVGWTYKVEERVRGGRSFSMALPASPATQDYTDLVPVPANDGTAVVVGPAGPVQTKASIGLGNVDNTADVNKPASAPQIAAFALRGGPRLTYSQVARRGDHTNYHNNAASSFTVFEDINTSFDNVYKTSGPTYALEDHGGVGTVTQAIYRSLDGGYNWTKWFDLTIDSTAGTWYEGIFVSQVDQTIYLLKVTNAKSTPKVNYVESRGVAGTATLIGSLNIGAARWLSSAHSIDSCASKDNTIGVTMMSEYGDGGPATVRLWRTTNRGATWTAVLTKTGNNDVPNAGEVAHFHAVQIDPFTRDWWLASGDGDAQSTVSRSTDDGLTWTTLFSGSQRERTCGFVFTPTDVYYGMDSAQKTLTHSKIVRITKSDLSRTDVATVYAGRAVYSLTRTWSPAGFLVWSGSEGASNSLFTGDERVQWFDFITGILHDVATFPTATYSTSLYHGFISASRYQDVHAGTIYARPTLSLGQLQTDTWNSSWVVSRVGRATLTMG